MIPTIAPSAIECQNTKRKIMPSLPSWLVAAVATQIDFASPIFPTTPPALFAEVIKIGSKCNFPAVSALKLPAKPVDEGLLPGRSPPPLPQHGHPNRNN